MVTMVTYEGKIFYNIEIFISGTSRDNLEVVVDIHTPFLGKSV